MCIVTTGEAEINAAATIMSMTLSTKFDLTSTYFLVAGIAGINPYHGTLGTAAFARFSVQVSLAANLAEVELGDMEADSSRSPSHRLDSSMSLMLAKSLLTGEFA